MNTNSNSTNKSVSYSLGDSLFVNNHGAFIFKKIEKIVMALYMISEFFPEKEPLKWNIRQSANDIIKDILILTKKTDSTTVQSLKNVHRNMLEVLSYMSLGHSVGLISNMNYTLLDQEISKVIKDIQNESKRHPDVSETIEPDLFKVEMEKEEVSSKGQMAHIKDTKKDKKLGMSFSGSVSEFHKVLSANTNKGQNKSTTSKTNQSGSSSNDRHQKILDILKEKGRVSIKDVVYEIPGCSSKTIQRDLQKLINDGLVSKEGERRWSEYFLTP